MNFLENIIDLPVYIQVVIATGYIGYSLAKRGLRDKERKDELFYGIMVFGLIGYSVMSFLVGKEIAFIPAIAISLVITVIIAILWRKVLRDLVNKILHDSRIANEDGSPSVWIGLMQNTKIIPTQLSIKLINGERLSCRDVQAFGNAPVPRFYADNDGNIALYVTDKIKKDGSKAKRDDVFVEGWGERLTFVKKEMIESVSIRYKDAVSNK